MEEEGKLDWGVVVFLVGGFCLCFSSLVVVCFFFNLPVAFWFLPIWNNTSLRATCEGVIIQGAGQSAEFPFISYYLGAASQQWAVQCRHKQAWFSWQLGIITIKYNTGLCVTVLSNFFLKVTLGFWVMGVPKPVVIYFDESKSVHVFLQFGCSVICNYIASSTKNTLWTNTCGWTAQIIAIHLSKWH